MKTLTTTIKQFAAIAAISLLPASAAMANSYLTFANGDVSNFVNANGREISVKIVAKGNSGWNKYSQFLSEGERWVWTTPVNESVYLFNEESRQSEKMVDFADPVGTNYNFKLGSCGTGGRLEEKGLTMSTAAGTFNNVVRMSFISRCNDGGTQQAWFAPKVGIIKWSSDSIIGSVDTNLVSAKVGSSTYGLFSAQQAWSTRASFPNTYFLVGNSQKEVTAKLSVTNISRQNLALQFTSGQDFEITLLDSSGQVMNVWSANKRFTQALRDVSFAAGTTQTFGGTLPLINMNGGALRTGYYTVRIELKAQRTVVGSQVLPTALSAETQIYVQQAL